MRKPRPDWSPLGVNFKILDEHPRLFHIRVSSPATEPVNSNEGLSLSLLLYLIRGKSISLDSKQTIVKLKFRTKTFLLTPYERWLHR